MKIILIIQRNIFSFFFCHSNQKESPTHPMLTLTISITNGKQFQAVLRMNHPIMNSHGLVQKEQLIIYVL